MEKTFIFIDFETYWDSAFYTLSKMGPIEYVRDPRFHAQLLGVRIGDTTKVLEGDDIAKFLRGIDCDRRDLVFVGHNIHGFDALVMAEHYGVRPYYVVDTLCLARKSGIARFQSCSHAALTDYLRTGVKTAGTVISDGKMWPYGFTALEREQFRAYCADDVNQCAENFKRLLPYLDENELEFQSLTARMTMNPMLHIERDVMTEFVKKLDAETEAARQSVMRDFHFADVGAFLKAVRSKKAFVTMVESLGSSVPVKLSAKQTETARKKLEERAASGDVDAQASLANPDSYAVFTPALSKTDMDFLAMLDDPDERVATLVRARLDTNSSIHKSRAERFLALSAGGRPLPVMLQCYKAHTGRYAAGNAEGKSDAVNFQNLSKRNPKHVAIRKGITAPKGHVLVSCDSSQIEARMLAFIAGQDDLVRAFAHGEDPYSQLSSRIYGIPWQDISEGAKQGDKDMKNKRNVGKTAILSAGYQVGAGKFSDTLWRMGVRLAQDRDKHRALATQAHYIYRESNSRIVTLWTQAQGVVRHLAMGGEGSFGGPQGNLFAYGMMPVVASADAIPSVRVPSGYMLRYKNLRAQQGETKHVEYVYDTWAGRNLATNRIYGGLLTENITQSESFFLLIYQAVLMAKRGVPLIGNIHDAWVACVREEDADATAAIMRDCMTQVPPHLIGLPVACSIEIGTDYTVA